MNRRATLPIDASFQSIARPSWRLELLGVLVASAMLAGGAGAADLLSLHRLALENDANFAAAQAEHQAAIEAVPQAVAQLLPRIEADATINRSHVVNESLVLGKTRESVLDFTNNNYGLNLSQPVYRPQLWAQRKQADAQVSEAEARLETARQDLTLKLAQTYFDTLLASENINLLKEQKVAIKAQLLQAQRLYASGYGTVTDVNEAQARLDSTDARDIEARNIYQIRLNALAQITGKVPDTLLPLGAEVSLPDPRQESLDDWIKRALDQNQALRAARNQLEYARQENEKARAGHHPTLDIVAGYRHEVDPSYTTVGSTNDIAEVGLRAVLPLYSGGYVDSRVRQTSALVERARNQLESIQRQVVQKTREAYLNVVSGIAQVSALDQALRSHEIALFSMEKGFKAGVRTSVDILNEQQLLYQAKRDLYQARYGYLLSRMKLKHAASYLNEEEVHAVNALLDKAS